MTSINVAGSSMQLWMVQALFGASGQASATTATAAPNSRASSSVNSALLKIAPATGAAVAKLGSRDSAKAADPLARGLDQQIADDNRTNALMLSNSRMSSAEVEADMYGAGITAIDPAYNGNKPTISFMDIINENRQDGIERHQDTQTNPDLSQFKDAENLQYQEGMNFLDQVTAAYQNHTLVFQNASDVQGLDFSRFASHSSSPGVSSTTGSQKYDQDWYENRPDKDHSRMLDTGGNLTIYVTW